MKMQNQKKKYADNDERFLFFAKGCLETLKLLHWQPDIIHCNDWQTSLIPFLLKTSYKDDPFFKDSNLLLTVHNFVDQGEFSEKFVNKFDFLSDNKYPGSQVELKGKFNFLKAGLLSSDLVNVVGESYVKKIQQDSKMTFGLDDIIKKRRRILSGISKGIDTTVWDPEVDKHLENQYSKSSLKDKLVNKNTFLESVGLTCGDDLPLLVVKLDSDTAKTFKQLDKLFSDLLDLSVQIFVTGELSSKIQKVLVKLSKTSDGNLSHSATILEDKPLHLMLAAADLFLFAEEDNVVSLNPLHAIAIWCSPSCTR